MAWGDTGVKQDIWDEEETTTSLAMAVSSGSTTVVPDLELSRFPRPLLTFAAAATMVVMIVGLLGNLLTVFALLRCPRLRNVAAAFIISLCAADFLFCLLVLPFSTSRFVHGTWIHGGALCTLFPFLRYGNIGVSLLSIAMITVNRYIMIAHHNIYHRVYTKLWIAVMIAFCWVFSYGMQLPTLFGLWGSFGYDEKLGTCSILGDSENRSSKTALFITGFLTPCIVIVVCYARIFWVVHSSEKRMRKHANASGNKGEEDARKKKSDREAKTKRNEWRITKMVLAIFLSFLVCYLPITIVKVTDKEVSYPGFHVLGYILLYLSACINPIIYVIMNKQYRQAYKTVLLCRRPRLLSFTAPPPSSLADKSKEIHNSKTLVSHVSLAMTPVRGSKVDNMSEEDLPDVFDDSM
ncbi:G-protein coupled receptor moody isoform X1 [Ischnura elegans]|uniref:G-protein coupled receptor moody isoform X1 n=1 Tax=Ischnura elegans TaxID=197161 RepID=UPI001ED8966F|nr:G-protein coupled receptor moody isoform X1 [Ischnura elegans]XP_046383808.1 G-protein coupled receptor moody isoform X1 [Ischnura elegans]XP_046383809.1 G-protein coupled receptor moody isoform X1 [Ischnura elegans]